MSAQTPDVTVLGAGLIGICSALSLAEAGLHVRLVDRDAPGQATSYGNAGVISPWSVVPQVMPGMWKSLPGWVLDPLGPVSVRTGYLPKLAPWALRALAQARPKRVHEVSNAMELLTRDCVTLFRQALKGTGHEDLIRDSLYVHAFRDAAKADPNEAGYVLRSDKGAILHHIGAQELRALEPALSPDFRAAIVIEGQGRTLSPGRLGAVLADRFRAMGGEVLQREVLAIRPGDTGWICNTDQGEIASPKLVLSMGVWSARLLEPLGLRVPLEAERGYHLEFPEPGVVLNNSVMDMDMKFVASTMENGLRVAGTAEFAGLDRPPNTKRIAGLQKLAARMMPDLDQTDMRTWMGQRPSLPDGLPCIGELEKFPGLITAFGHSHYGLMMAPRTGHLVAGLVTGRRENEDMTALRPERF